MELLFEILFELVVGSSLDGANDSELPKGLRIGLLIFVSLIYAIFTAFFVWLLLTADNILLKVISGGVVLLIVGVFIILWRKVIKAKKSVKI